MAASEASFLGRLALVTGGAGSVGEAKWRILAAEGATLVVADKDLEGARKVADSLPGDGKRQVLYVDVGDSLSVQQLFNRIREIFAQPLSAVVHSAGIGIATPLADRSDDVFDETVRVNMKGTFLVTRASILCMLRSSIPLPEGGAAIVNVASTSANAWGSPTPAYAASKAGVLGLTKSAANELAPHGIRCNASCQTGQKLL